MAALDDSGTATACPKRYFGIDDCITLQAMAEDTLGYIALCVNAMEPIAIGDDPTERDQLLNGMWAALITCRETLEDISESLGEMEIVNRKTQ